MLTRKRGLRCRGWLWQSHWGLGWSRTCDLRPILDGVLHDVTGLSLQPARSVNGSRPVSGPLLAGQAGQLSFQLAIEQPLMKSDKECR